ncbi:chorismate mutase, partial [Candidatus Altiarchaeota archaeon]
MPIEDLRVKIDGIDERILALIEERVETAEKIGRIKRKKGLPVEDKDREAEVLGRLTGKTKLKKDFIRNIYNHIIEYC